MKVTQVCISRFHHFHLARQLEKFQLLDTIYTGYPRFKLADEQGIPRDKIHTFPWLQTPYMVRRRLGLDQLTWLNREWSWLAHETLDRYVASKLREPTVLIALSGSGLFAGKKAKELGGVHICDRGSSHIRLQENLLIEEYQRYGATWQGIDPRSISKEESEYEQADLISVPSQFCYESFVEQGISTEKLIKIPYGARLERFYPDNSSKTCSDAFRILFVGAAGPRKGFIDLLSAFERLSNPKKQLLLIGSLAPEAEKILSRTDQSKIKVLGSVANAKLRQFYNQASVFVLPSIEEGLAMVLGEALSCGCPVIASTNTGASELITDGVEGFIVPIRSPEVIADRLQQMSDDSHLTKTMGEAALKRVEELGGWNKYGDYWLKALKGFSLLD